jgi:hypothetical protein
MRSLFAFMRFTFSTIWPRARTNAASLDEVFEKERQIGKQKRFEGRRLYAKGLKSRQRILVSWLLLVPKREVVLAVPDDDPHAAGDENRRLQKPAGVTVGRFGHRFIENDPSEDCRARQKFNYGKLADQLIDNRQEQLRLL